MNAREYIVYLGSPPGILALRDAKLLLERANPEVDDTALLEKVVSIGFPDWAARRVFYHCTLRYAPIVCRSCSKEFRPRSPFTIDRPYCNRCANPKTPEQEIQARAHGLAKTAQNNGKIKRGPCEECGATLNLHMHHPDYSRPLFVKWLCARCHTVEHKKLQASA